ncbi:MAG: cytochrome C, partial [Puniceicoccales bacterium]
MPIYEFYCKQNNTVYSFLSQRMIGPEEVPICPANPEYGMERMVSAFSVTGRHKERDESGEGPDLDDPRMEAAMAELEGEMAGIDEENPDPRQMGKLMRRMAEITGEPLGGQMEEMVRKMEEGTDLDSLEEDFGDAMDDDGLDAPEEGSPT